MADDITWTPLTIETIQLVLDAAKELELLYGDYPKARVVAAHMKLLETHDPQGQHPQRNRPSDA